MKKVAIAIVVVCVVIVLGIVLAKPLMKSFSNQEANVTISGTVTFDAYESGVISVGAWSEGKRWGPDLGRTEIPKPGKYSLEVPKNAGKVYIKAVNIVTGDGKPAADDPRGEFARNPLDVAASDIGGVDIKLSK